MTQKLCVLLLVAMFASSAGADWKGWVHTHSRFSDGELTPVELARRAKIAGVKFVLTLDHIPGIEAATKEINLRKVQVGPEFVGMENYLKTWEKLTKDTGIVFVPGVEYTFSRSHLGVVNINLELHHQIMPVFNDRAKNDDQKIKKILEVVRGTQALPLICHPTLKVKHPKRTAAGGVKIKGTEITDYSFPHELWKDEPIKLVECMNHGNIDSFEDMVPLIMQAEQAVPGSVILTAGNDFHTDSAELLGIFGNGLLGLPRVFAKAFERYTCLKTDRTDLTAQSVIEELRKGNTYITYGQTRFNPDFNGRDIVQYEDYPEILVDFGKKLPLDMRYILYRDNGSTPLARGLVANEPARAGDGVDDTVFEFDDNNDKDEPKAHVYLLVFPGKGVVGPIRQKPSGDTLIRNTVNLLQMFIIGMEKAERAFRIDLTPSQWGDAKTGPIKASQEFDINQTLDVYIYVDIWNPRFGEVVTIKDSLLNQPQQVVVNRRVEPGSGVRYCHKIQIVGKKVSQITVAVTARDITKTVTLTLKDPIRFTPGWKQVEVEGLSFQVPQAWYADGGSARDSRQGYCGKDPNGGFMGFVVDKDELNVPITAATKIDSLPCIAAYAKILGRSFQEKGGFRWLIVDWSAPDKGMGPERHHVIFLQPVKSSKGWIVDFLLDDPVPACQKDILEKIKASIKLE